MKDKEMNYTFTWKAATKIVLSGLAGRPVMSNTTTQAAEMARSGQQPSASP